MTQIILETEDLSEISQLRDEIISKRETGAVWLEIKKLPANINLKSDDDITKIVNSFVNQLGCSSLGNYWKQINQEQAKKILTAVLNKDLAYSQESMKLADAQKLADKFISFFQNNCQFFTNAEFTSNYSRLLEWNPITEATFDSGVVIVSNERIGLLWLEDED